jgi:hypothetical protein
MGDGGVGVRSARRESRTANKFDLRLIRHSTSLSRVTAEQLGVSSLA